MRMESFQGQNEQERQSIKERLHLAIERPLGRGDVPFGGEHGLSVSRKDTSYNQGEEHYAHVIPTGFRDSSDNV